MTKINNIAAEFDAMKPEIAAEYVEFVRRQFDRLVEKYGNGRALSDLSGKWGQDGGMWRAIRGNTKRDSGDRASASMQDPIIMDEARLAKNAAEYADFAVAAFVSKLVAKLADLDGIEISRMNAGAGTFLITGKLRGRDVTVEQSRVFKISNKGTPFHQWPARIYVDGKFVSEKAFKEIAA